MADGLHGSGSRRADRLSPIALEDVAAVAEPENGLVMRPLVRADVHGDDVSVTWVRLSGRHRRLRTDRSTRVYHILEGAATFRIGDSPPAEVAAGDTVVVPRGVDYDFEGTVTYLVINGPGFREGDDVYA